MCQLLAIFQHVDRRFIVRHGGLLTLIKSKGPPLYRLKIGTVTVIDFEVEHILGNQGEEKPLQIESRPAEHPLGKNLACALELFENEIHILVINRHSPTVPHPAVGWQNLPAVFQAPVPGRPSD